MQLTLGQIMSLTTSLNQGRNDYSTSDLSLYANMALNELCQRVEMQALNRQGFTSIQSGAANFNANYQDGFGALTDYIKGVSNQLEPPNSPQRALIPTTKQWIDSQDTQTGIPTHWAPFRELIYVWPSANSPYQFEVTYQTKPQALMSSNQTPNIDERWVDAVAYRAAAIAAAARNDLEQEAINQARYLAFVQSLPSDRAIKQRAEGGFTVRMAWPRKQ